MRRVSANVDTPYLCLNSPWLQSLQTRCGETSLGYVSDFIFNFIANVNIDIASPFLKQSAVSITGQSNQEKLNYYVFNMFF